MKIQIDNQDYTLDMKKALNTGCLQPIILKETIELTQDEAAVLLRICRCIGGNPNKARGCMDNIKDKIQDRFGSYINTNLDLALEDTLNKIYFKD